MDVVEEEHVLLIVVLVFESSVLGVDMVMLTMMKKRKIGLRKEVLRAINCVIDGCSNQLCHWRFDIIIITYYIIIFYHTVQ